jgi:hypothetical protein
LIDSDKVKSALPQITVPTDFDVMTTDMIGEMLTKARQGNFDPLIISGIEDDYVEKLYGENSMQQIYLKILKQLDPLPYKTTDEKTLLLNSQGCSLQDYVLSANLPAFVMQLVDEDAAWYDKPITVQRIQVDAMAASKVDQIRSAVVPIMPAGM